MFAVKKFEFGGFGVWISLITIFAVCLKVYFNNEMRTQENAKDIIELKYEVRSMRKDIKALNIKMNEQQNREIEEDVKALDKKLFELYKHRIEDKEK